MMIYPDDEKHDLAIALMLFGLLVAGVLGGLALGIFVYRWLLL